MDSKKDNNLMSIETDEAIYRFEFSEVQFEITGICNMNCEHCRGAFDEKVDLDRKQIVKIISFARKYSPNFKEITLSGGEPFMHKEFRKILFDIRNLGVTHITLTTNGSFISNDILDYIKSLDFARVTFSVSLDNLDESTHNKFRNHPNAYNIAINALKKL